MEAVVFVNFFWCGMNYLFSDFMESVLTFFMIELVHLIPNLVLILAIFEHLCEVYIRSYPELEILHFYVLKKTRPSAMGCVSF